MIPNEAGRVFDEGAHLTGLYTTGWIKRGPVGLIGHTKGDGVWKKFGEKVFVPHSFNPVFFGSV